jgi:hypothetical protein
MKTVMALRTWGIVAAACAACSSPSHAGATTDGSIDSASTDASTGSGSAAPVDAAMAVDDPCLPSPHAGHEVYPCNGFAFDVEVPAACLGGGCGMIFDVAGRTMNAAMEDANTQMRARGTAAGYVVIQPNANPAPPQSTYDPSPTSDAKLYDFLTRAIAVYRSDPHRVHMTGFSEGGFMTWRFLCDHADLFASVAPGAAASNCTVLQIPACSFTGAQMPSRQVPVLYMHGTADEDYVQYECAQPQIDAMVTAWGLTSQGVIASDATYRRTRWTNGSGGLLEFISHDYYSDQEVLFIPQTKLEGHCYPGSTDPGGLTGQLFSFKCEQPAAFTWGDEVMKFFVAHPKP